MATVVAALAVGGPAAAADHVAPGVPLASWSNPDLGADWLSLELARELFPEAEKVEPLESVPPVAPVFAGGILQGYVFATRDVTQSLGFSSLEFLIAVGLRLDGTLAGAKVVHHQEPIIGLIMLQDLVPRFTAQYAGIDIRLPMRVSLTRVQEPGAIDGISAATISAVLFNEAILRAARLVARAKGIRLHDQPVLDIVTYRERDFAGLVADGSIGRLRITKDAARAAGVADADLSNVAGAGNLYVYAHERDSGAVPPAFPEDLLIDLYVGPVMPPTVGRNLLGATWHDLFVSGRNPENLMLGIMTVGPYSIDGEKHLSSGPFRRLSLRQDGREFAISKDHYRFLGFLHGTDKPAFAEMGLFWIPAATGIDPIKPWTLVLTVESADRGETAEFTLDYTLDAQYVVQPSGVEVISIDDPPPAWLAAWRAQRLNIAILLVALAALTAILTSLDRLATRPRLLQVLRLGFLGFVLAWLGWQVGAQVTIVNLLTWLQSLISGNGLTVFLSDPLIVVLMAFVVVSFVIWGRGVFCGWLCPFGAMQELLGKAAQALGLRQLSINHRAHKLLWPIKYVVLAGLVGLSFYSMAMANTVAEVEPFKTAISLQFARDWPYVVYAVTLLTIGLTVERFYCRFLCPLGAAMAIGGKLRLLNPLKRRAECGSPCQLCSHRCPIGAIAPNGTINMTECFYCLDCQVLYHDAHQCPPLVSRSRQGWQPEAAGREATTRAP